MTEPVALSLPLRYRTSPETCRNLLLRGLTPADRQLLWPYLEPVQLQPRRVLHYPHIPIEHTYFVDSGLVSVIASTCERKAVEVWLIGKEGFVGIPAALGEPQSPHRRVVQLGGSALRIRSDKLLAVMREIPRLNELLLYYAQAVLVQTAQLGACNANHSLQRRLARWMLMAQDRSEMEDLPLTHEMLARMLGVRRASVTECIAAFERSGLLEAGRSMIRILDRAQLKETTCRCYRTIRAADRRLREKCLGSEPQSAGAMSSRATGLLSTRDLRS